MAATDTSSAPVGPVPFKDVDGDQASAFPEQQREGLSDLADMVSSLPSKMEVHMPVRMICYQGFWLPEEWLPAAVPTQRSFMPRPDGVIVASHRKGGTTWLSALEFATMARHRHPLNRRLNPHQCLPFLEGLFTSSREAMLDTLQRWHAALMKSSQASFALRGSHLYEV